MILLFIYSHYEIKKVSNFAISSCTVAATVYILAQQKLLVTL